jgi:serine/threonine-protein kinase
MPIDEALPIAKQIAEAIEAAHEQGIVHRDLKPANIKVRADGTVKVLDFGLAKLAEPAAVAGTATLTQSPTITTPAMTAAGLILGTAAYMSPEQAKGRPADQRSDVWAFGCVLYEMITGARAFPGDDFSETFASVIRAQPSWEALPPAVPHPIRRLLQRSLQKDRGKRLAAIADARADIEEGLESPVAPPPNLHRAPGASSVAIGLLAVAVCILIGFGGGMYWTHRSVKPTNVQSIRFVIAPQAGAHLSNSLLSRRLALTPDGKTLVYVGEDGGLFKRTLGELEISRIPGLATTAGLFPFISPDGQWIAYLSPSGIRRVSISGGQPTTICQTPQGVTGATWTDDGRVIFAAKLQLMSVPASGGNPKPIDMHEPAADGRSEGMEYAFPFALPGSRAILFEIVPIRTPDASQIAVLDLTSGRYTVLVRGANSPLYADGLLFYASRGAVRAVRFDPVRAEIQGEPTTVVEGVRTRGDIADYAVAAGAVAYVAGTGGDFSASSSIVWVDREGRETPVSIPRRDYGSIQLSPDGMRIVLDVRDRLANSIWTWDIQRQNLMPLTVDQHSNDNPMWTADGRRVVFRSDRTTGGLFWQNADGTGEIEELSTGPLTRYAKSTTADGKHILFTESVRPGVMRIGVLTPDAPAESREQILVDTNALNNNPAVSPDGKWLAYQSDEGGNVEVHVRPFPSVSGGHWKVSTAGGQTPVWNRDGRELFYFDPNRILTSVDVQPGPAFVWSPPRPLLKTPYIGTGGWRSYDVSSDGTRFLMMKEDVRTAESSSIVVTVNGFAELKARLSTK